MLNLNFFKITSFNEMPLSIQLVQLRAKRFLINKRQNGLDFK
jgi:hypothetical protein